METKSQLPSSEAAPQTCAFRLAGLSPGPHCLKGWQDCTQYGPFIPPKTSHISGLALGPAVNEGLYINGAQPTKEPVSTNHPAPPSPEEQSPNLGSQVLISPPSNHYVVTLFPLSDLECLPSTQFPVTLNYLLTPRQRPPPPRSPLPDAPSRQSSLPALKAFSFLPVSSVPSQ